MAWFASGWTRVWLGQLDIAMEHLARAMRLSPLDQFIIVRAKTGTAHAHFLAGRYEEASTWARGTFQDRPDYYPGLRIGAASNALAGRLEEAKKLCARLQQLDPTLRVSNLRYIVGPYRPEDLARYEEALRKAGLPE